VDNGGDDGADCFEIKIWTDTAKLTMWLTDWKCGYLVRESETTVKYESRLRAEWVMLRWSFVLRLLGFIVYSWYLSPMRRNSVLGELRDLQSSRRSIRFRNPGHNPSRTESPYPLMAIVYDIKVYVRKMSIYFYINHVKKAKFSKTSIYLITL